MLRLKIKVFTIIISIFIALGMPCNSIGQTAIPYSNNFSNENASTWTGTGWKYDIDGWEDIGKLQYLILNTDSAYILSGTKSMGEITDIAFDESEGRVSIYPTTEVNEVYIRFYVYHKFPFYHPAAYKTWRAGAYNGSLFNGFQAMGTIRGDGSGNYYTIRIEANGGTHYLDWGSLSSTITGNYADDGWIYIETYIKLNTVYAAPYDGQIKMWVARHGQPVSYGSPTATKDNVGIVDEAGHLMNYFHLGGNYSNGGVAPPYVSTRYFDALTISTSWIGPINSGSTLNGVTMMQGMTFR